VIVVLAATYRDAVKALREKHPDLNPMDRDVLIAEGPNAYLRISSLSLSRSEDEAILGYGYDWKAEQMLSSRWKRP